MSSKKCLFCKEVFKGHGNRKFCSMKCKDAYKVRKPMGYKEKCIQCGELYDVVWIDRRNKRKVCSVSCSNVFHSAKTVKAITLEEIEEIVIASESQPTAQGIADILGTSKTTVVTRVKAKYGSFRSMVEEVRGKYLDSTRNGVGHTASILFNALDDLGFNGTREKTFDDLRNPETIVLLRIDYFVEELGLAVEYHGKQHYEYIPFFHDKAHKKYAPSLEDCQKRDKLKSDYLKTKGIELVVWRYDEPVSRESIEERFSKLAS